MINNTKSLKDLAEFRMRIEKEPNKIRKFLLFCLKKYAQVQKSYVFSLSYTNRKKEQKSNDLNLRQINFHDFILWLILYFKKQAYRSLKYLLFPKLQAIFITEREMQ
ncbi:hypothetical protein TTHERM_001388158 (macronuclear) [Tetrahymena thermophila SB210]|uniref:Uncharacterized protein n=1 Tax=Tetrahymena thermophila (strain SB210) TaxID=312017 RepID=W7XDK9_TETTS|nr:hypothetical protein TTHERM_001388158 [Tetrahymena thermophila SB210]EWS71931.1 hypothetical protein TTHERM_001388158 [Tetrahymena thermophila SB210]|eukprot:XP_012655532.1 hypothetical protein TTHERM_001388158 [Tetrahymena thermophila SB210]